VAAVETGQRKVSRARAVRAAVAAVQLAQLRQPLEAQTRAAAVAALDLITQSRLILELAAQAVQALSYCVTQTVAQLQLAQG
jgi:hypothetical protein